MFLTDAITCRTVVYLDVVAGVMIDCLYSVDLYIFSSTFHTRYTFYLGMFTILDCTYDVPSG